MRDGRRVNSNSLKSNRHDSSTSELLTRVLFQDRPWIVILDEFEHLQCAGLRHGR